MFGLGLGMLGLAAKPSTPVTPPDSNALVLEDATSILLLEDGGYLLLEG